VVGSGRHEDGGTSLAYFLKKRKVLVLSLFYEGLLQSTTAQTLFFILCIVFLRGASKYLSLIKLFLCSCVSQSTIIPLIVFGLIKFHLTNQEEQNTDQANFSGDLLERISVTSFFIAVCHNACPHNASPRCRESKTTVFLGRTCTAILS
jgi:hypothetical protein